MITGCANRRIRPTGHDEAGAILVLALVFTVIIGAVLLGLLTLSSNDLLNTTNLRTQRSLEYAADGATTAAVQAVRNSYLAYCYGETNAPTYCASADGQTGAICTPQGVVVTVDNQAMIVDCTNVLYNPPASNTPSAQTREVNFYTCSSSNTATNACMSTNAVLWAQVTFDDYAPGGGYSCSPTLGTSSCGSSETIDSWVIETANK